MPVGYCALLWAEDSARFGFTLATRDENAEALAQDAENLLGFLLIFAAIAIFSAFKRSRQEGVKVLGFCIALALLVLFFPKAGMVVIGVLGLIIAWGLFRSFR